MTTAINSDLLEACCQPEIDRSCLADERAAATTINSRSSQFTRRTTCGDTSTAACIMLNNVLVNTAVLRRCRADRTPTEGEGRLWTGTHTDYGTAALDRCWLAGRHCRRPAASCNVDRQTTTSVQAERRCSLRYATVLAVCRAVPHIDVHAAARPTSTGRALCMDPSHRADWLAGALTPALEAH